MNTITNNNIKSSSIQIHNDPQMNVTTIVPSFEITDNENNKCWEFGILEIEMEEVSVTKQPLFIAFDVDISSSMSDIGKDGKTRMQHVHNTFENMIKSIASQEVDVYISVDGFDDAIQNVIEPSLVTIDNMNELIKSVKTMTPRGSTNIGLALHSINNRIKTYKLKNPTHKLFHILLTDGAATVGELDPDRLSREICEDYVNIFLGVGSDHNTKMLQQFANFRNAEYRFIDNGENAGMVYGEILQRILRPAIEDVTIEICNGEIYDWKSSSWRPAMNEDVIDSEANKIYHIRTLCSQNVKAIIYGKVSSDKEPNIRELDIVTPIPHLINEEGTVEEETCNLTKYLYRQQTLIFLNICSTFPVESYGENNARKRDMRKKLADFFRSMRVYMRTNNLLHDSFMRMLCDDIVVAYKTVGTRSANMHCTSRNHSQGAQRSCTTQCEDIDDINISMPIPSRLHRQVGRRYYPEDIENINYGDAQEIDLGLDMNMNTLPQTFSFPSLSFEHPPSPNLDVILENDKNDEDSIEQYILVSTPKMDFENATYTTPGRIKMMREVSGH